MFRLDSTILVRLIQFILLFEAVTGIVTGTWSAVFVALATLVMTILPQRFARWLGLNLPSSFLTAIAVFVFATLFLGEVADFYEKFWWWDVALHFASALGFGLVAFLLIFMLFQGDRYAAPPWALASLAFCVGVSIGAVWEIFEFAMDQTFDMNMQKSGLVDTMADLIIDCIGAGIGAIAGFMYLKGHRVVVLAIVMQQFVVANRRFYGKLKKTGRRRRARPMDGADQSDDL